MDMGTLRPTIGDTLPVTDFRAKIAAAIHHVQETQRPFVLTQHGHNAAVLVDVRVYERLVDSFNALEVRKVLDKSEAEIERGEVIPHEALMAELRAKYPER